MEFADIVKFKIHNLSDKVKWQSVFNVVPLLVPFQEAVIFWILLYPKFENGRRGIELKTTDCKGVGLSGVYKTIIILVKQKYSAVLIHLTFLDFSKFWAPWPNWVIIMAKRVKITNG